MMVKISRYILVIIGILAASVALPELYWTIFEQVPRTPNVYYSCTLNDFIMLRSGDNGIIRHDTKGNTYTLDEFEQHLPMMFFRQLMTDGTMPDSIHGVEMDPTAINKARSYFRYTTKDMLSPRPRLWPMFESESGRVNLAMPDDYFRITTKIEFIDAATNKVNQEKSAKFTRALEEHDFAFPARLIAGIPTTRKSCDEGYFVKDSRGDLFHVKMIKGEPYVARIDIPDPMDILHIECVDLRSKEFYCYLFTRHSGVFVVMEGVYHLQRLPVEGFDPFQHEMKINCDMFNKTFAMEGEDFLKVVAVDDMYEVVDTYEETWDGIFERPDGKMFASIFPFELELRTARTGFVNFYFTRSPGFTWLLVNLVFVGLAVWLILRRKGNLLKNIPDLLIVLVTGVFGFIGTQVFPNKFYD
ncbi:MAG TPA: DUF4857 domain-containing protein [Bacteroidetes bacterium]|mgnify:CR=1 FL=1|nr:DUF4857 domain-containing protein [Bacteroidota bacterium]